MKKKILTIFLTLILLSICIIFFVSKKSFGAGNIILTTETAANSYLADTGSSDKKWQGSCVADNFVVVCAFRDSSKDLGNIYVFDKKGNQKDKVAIPASSGIGHHCNSVTYDSNKKWLIIAAKAKKPLAYAINQSTGKLTKKTLSFNQTENYNGTKINPTAIAYNPIADNFVVLYSYVSKFYIYSSADFYANKKSSQSYPCIQYSTNKNCQQATAKNNFLYYLIQTTVNSKKINYIYVYDLLDKGALVDTIEETNSNLELEGLSFDAKNKYLYVSWHLHDGTKYKKFAVYKTNLKSTNFYRHTANFVGNGGSNGNSIQKYYKSNLGSLPTSTRTGYSFQGWFTTKSGGTKISPQTVASQDATYYAHWSPVSYTISCSLNGGTATNTRSYTIESNNITLNNPTKSGYTFTGWTGTGLSSATKTVTIPKGSTGNKSYTANWSPISYTINYSLNGGTATNPGSYTIESNNITLNNPTKSGYTFTGWTGTGLSSATKTVTIPKGSTGNKSYTANWLPNKYKISFDTNGGTGGQSSDVTATYDAVMPDITTEAPTRTHYTFMGWYDNKDYTKGTKYYEADGTSSKKFDKITNITLYARWKGNIPDPIVTSYNSEYDGLAHGVSVAEITDGTVHYSLDGINYSTIAPTFKDVTNGAIKVYIKVVADSSQIDSDVVESSITITKKDISVTWGNTSSFNYDENSHIPTVTTPVNGVGSEKITISVSGEQTNPGNYTATATILSVAGGKADNYNIIQKTKSFTINPRITFYRNDVDATGTTETQWYTYNSETEVALNKNGFKKTDYIFDSWNTKADGSGTKYNDGQKIKNQTSNLNLYAQWKNSERIFESDVYKIDDEKEIISYVPLKQNISEFNKNITSTINYEILDANGNYLSENSYIATGCMLKTDSKTYKIVVLGDLNGSGDLRLNDLAQAQKLFLEIIKEDEIKLLAADLNKNGKIDLNDLARMQKIFLEI